MRKKVSNNIENFAFLQYPIGHIQETNSIVDKNTFEEKYHYYDAVLHEQVLQDYFPYLRTQGIKSERDFFY